MHYLSSDGQPGLHLLSRRGHRCAEDAERAYASNMLRVRASRKECVFVLFDKDQLYYGVCLP